MADQARDWTDDQLEALTKRYEAIYSQAEREMREKLAKSLDAYAKENTQRRKAMDDTQEAHEEYEAWKRSQASNQAWMRGMVDSLSESAANANRLATDMLNDSLPHIYAENANMAAFALDGQLGYDTGFTLVNEDAVRYLMGLEDQETGYDQLIREVTWNPDPERSHVQDVRKREMDYPKDMRWNRQKFNVAITQGILQGESIPDIVKRTKDIYGRNKAAAVRAARTATTNAENAGRMNSFERAQALGIDMEIEWLATLDGRTRDSHRALDGERIQLGETFSNGLRWPADPLGSPSEIWNCRCRANGRVVGFDGKRGDWVDERGERWTRLPKGMTYDEWRKAKAFSRDASYKNPSKVQDGFWPQRSVTRAVVDGKDILGTWKRRPDQYDFDIEDVIAAQGFDGKPTILDADEFDAAVRAANGGDGLIMQRAYSAPDQETLDAYRESLYDGKWYVDCSHGADVYGRGMYTAHAKQTSVSEQMEGEIAGYRKAFSYVETMTMYPSARVIGYNELVAAKNDPEIIERAITADKELTDTERAIVRREVTRSYSEEDRALARVAEREWDFDDYMAVIKEFSTAEREYRELGTSELAVLLGYDAVEVPGLNYTIVLNRTKLIIRRPE